MKHSCDFHLITNKCDKMHVVCCHCSKRTHGSMKESYKCACLQCWKSNLVQGDMRWLTLGSWKRSVNTIKRCLVCSIWSNMHFILRCSWNNTEITFLLFQQERLAKLSYYCVWESWEHVRLQQSSTNNFFLGKIIVSYSIWYYCFVNHWYLNDSVIDITKGPRNTFRNHCRF